MRKNFLFWVIWLGWTHVNAQCPVADFISPVSACMNEEIRLTNSSSGAVGYTWDFCETPLKEPANVLHITSLNDAYRGAFCFDLIQTPSPVILSLRTSGILNYIPLSDDFTIGGPPVPISGLTGGFSLPRAIRILEEDENYFALVTNAASGQSMTLVNFGTTISNLASFTRLDGIGVSAANGMEVISNENDYDVFAGQNSGNMIYHLKFSGSITSTPAVRTFVVTGATSINHIKILKTCDGIIGIVSSLNNDKLFLLDFSEDLNSTPVVSEISYVGDPILDPAKFDVAFDEGEYYLLLQTNAGVVYRLKFGNSLRNAPISEKISMESVNGYDIKLISDGNNWKGLFVDLSVTNRRLTLLEFNSSCNISPSWSGEISPVLEFAQPGDYKITLNSVNSFGYTHAVSKTISITENTPPTLDIVSHGICTDSLVSFSSKVDKSITSYAWDFGDGNSSGDANPSHQYSNPNDYNVSLSVIDVNGCKASKSRSLNVYYEPQAAFTLPPSLLCTNNEFTFSTTTPDIYEGNLSYQWLIDNNPVSTQRDLQHTFTTTGAKEITLVTSIPGCSDELTKITSPVASGPLVDFSFSGACEDETFAFQSQVSDPVQSYVWDFGNGETSPDPNPELSFADHGDYSVSLTATNTIGCETVSAKMVSVHSKPFIDFTTNAPPNGCSGATTEFQNQSFNPDGRLITEWLWSFNDPNNPEPGTEIHEEHTFQEAASYNVSLTATTEDGCMSSDDNQITIHQSPSTDFTSTPACDDVPVLFSGAAGSDIAEWYWEVGTSYYTTSSPTHTFKSPGDYPLYLEVTGTNGCAAIITQNIHVPEPLVPDFSIIKNCVGQEATLTDVTTGIDAVVSREWKFQTGETFGASPLNYVFMKDGNEDLSLRVTTQTGCVYAINRRVNIVYPPVAEFSPRPSSGAYPLEVAFSNTSSGASHYLWNFGDETENTSVNSSPVYSFLEEGSYNVQLTAYNVQQCEHSITHTVTAVAPRPDADIELLTLTPNPDGSAKLIVTIHNKGNTILKELPMELDFEGNLALREIITGPVPPASRYNFVFNTGILNFESLRYLCVFLDLDNDLQPLGNRMCREFEHRLFSFPAYPNPASESMNLEWISESGKRVRISLTDGLGRTIFSDESTANEGLNHRTLALSGLRDGIYILLIEDDTTRNTQRIVLINKP